MFNSTWHNIFKSNSDSAFTWMFKLILVLMLIKKKNHNNAICTNVSLHESLLHWFGNYFVPYQHGGHIYARHHNSPTNWRHIRATTAVRPVMTFPMKFLGTLWIFLFCYSLFDDISRWSGCFGMSLYRLLRCQVNIWSDFQLSLSLC